MPVARRPCRRPFAAAGRCAEDEGGWRAVAPSALAFDDGWQVPRELTLDEIGDVVEAFAAAARRALAAGFRLLELHAAHGYLLHEFLSPLSNRAHAIATAATSRDARACRSRSWRPCARAWPAELPLSVRISASDWVDGGWTLEDSIALAKLFGPLGVDLVDCSSGALSPAQQIPLGPGYQVPFASAIRREAGIATASRRPDHRAGAGRGDPRHGRRGRDPARA